MQGAGSYARTSSQFRYGGERRLLNYDNYHRVYDGVQLATMTVVSLTMGLVRD